MTLGVLHIDYFFCFILLHISNGLVNPLLVRYVLYLTDLMSATCIPHFYLMVHRYIYSRYSFVFLILYQLYHSLSSSTLITFLKFLLEVTTWVTPQGCNRRLGRCISISLSLISSTSSIFTEDHLGSVSRGEREGDSE